MCPDSHRRFAVCYKRDADQENEDIASDEKSSLGQSKKKIGSQQDRNGQNQNINVCDQGMVANVNIARANDNIIDYIYSNYWAISLQLYGIIFIIVKNDKGKPKCFELVTKKSKLSNNDTFVAIKSSKWLSKALTQWLGIDYNRLNNYETTRRSKTTLPETFSHLNNLNKSAAVAGKTESQSKQSNASHSAASQRSPKDLKSPLDGEKQSIYPDGIPISINEKNKLIDDEMLYRPIINNELLLKEEARLISEIYYRNVTTRSSETTPGPAEAAAINLINKLAVTGRIGSQLKQSNASHSTARKKSHEELKTPPINGKKESLDPDDSCDAYITKKTSKENLNSEPVVTDEPSGIDESPIVSADKDEAISNGEESTDSDYDFEVMKLFAWLDTKDWARSYYDCDDGVVIHVDPGQVEASQCILAEQFPDFHKYSVVETEPGVCMYSADPFGEDEEKLKESNGNQTLNGQQNPAPTINTQPAEVGLNSAEEQSDTQTANTHSLEEEIGCQATGGYEEEHVEFESVLLQPGYTITSDEHAARFSGRVGSKGLTVAHIGPSNNIYHYSIDRQHLIGTMDKVLEVDVSVTHNEQTVIRRTTADLGLLNLTPQCRVNNIICVKDKESYKLKLYKGSINNGTALRITDQNGNEKLGKLTSVHFNLRQKRQDSSSAKEDDWSGEVRNMLRIQNEDRAISAEGDSGTLVTSIPKEGSNEVYVYGIVTHLHKEEKCEQPLATIANRLSDILDAIDGIPGKSVGLRDPSSKKIDFTEDEI